MRAYRASGGDAIAETVVPVQYSRHCSLRACTPPVSSAGQDQEIAARTLLGEAEKLIELALPQEALAIVDRVQSQYPGTEAAAYAQLRRANCYYCLQKYDDAVSTARAVAAANPRSVLGAWAQFVVGESLVEKGGAAEGITELLKVQDMLPDDKDTGPLDHARMVIGRVYDRLVKSRGVEDVTIVEQLGISASDSTSKARALSILAAYRGKMARPDLAGPLLRRLATECPAARADYDWAATEVALGYLQAHGSSGDFSAGLASILSSLSSSSLGSNTLARIHLALARYYRHKGDFDSSVAVLEAVKDSCIGTACGAELLYELGNSVHSAGRAVDACAALKQLAERFPNSGFTAPALYLAGTYAGSNRPVAIEALSALAEGPYDRRWKGLAALRLGSLYSKDDVEKARDYYTQAIGVFRESLERDVADHGNWRIMLESRISVAESMLTALNDAKGVR